MVQRFLRQRGVRPRLDGRIHRRDRRGAGRDGVRQPSVLSVAPPDVTYMFDTQELRAGSLPADNMPAVPLPPAGSGAADPSPGPPERRLQAPPRRRHRLRARRHRDDGADLLDDPDVPDGGPDSDRGRAEHVGRQPRRERSELLAGVGAVLQHAVPDSDEPRARAGGSSGNWSSQKHPDFNGNAPKPRDPITLIRQARASASTWMRALVSKPAPAGRGARGPGRRPRRKRRSCRRSSRARRCSAVPETRLVDVVYQHTQRRLRRAGRQHAGRGIHRAEPRPAAATTPGRCSTGSTPSSTKATAKVKASEDALTQYRETNNAQSLDDRQNVVVSRLNSLSETVTGEAHGAAAERDALRPGEERRSGQRCGGRVSAHREQPVGGRSRRAALATLKSEQATLAQNFGPGQPADEGRRSEGRRAPPGCSSPSGAGSSTTPRTTSRPPSRRNAASPATSSGRRADSMRPRPQERRLQDPDARLRRQPGRSSSRCSISRRTWRWWPATAPTTSG